MRQADEERYAKETNPDKCRDDSPLSLASHFISFKDWTGESPLAASVQVTVAALRGSADERMLTKCYTDEYSNFLTAELSEFNLNGRLTCRTNTERNKLVGFVIRQSAACKR